MSEVWASTVTSVQFCLLTAWKWPSSLGMAALWRSEFIVLEKDIPPPALAGRNPREDFKQEKIDESKQINRLAKGKWLSGRLKPCKSCARPGSRGSSRLASNGYPRKTWNRISCQWIGGCCLGVWSTVGGANKRDVLHLMFCKCFLGSCHPSEKDRRKVSSFLIKCSYSPHHSIYGTLRMK